MTDFMNLTPHALDIYDESGKVLLITIPASGRVARVAESVKWCVNKIETPADENKTEYLPVGERRFDPTNITGLPDPEPYVAYIVSMLTGFALGVTRPDVFVPGPEVRDSTGRIIGCAGLLQTELLSLGVTIPREPGRCDCGCDSCHFGWHCGSEECQVRKTSGQWNCEL
jgi:hypothetical protein